MSPQASECNVSRQSTGRRMPIVLFPVVFVQLCRCLAGCAANAILFLCCDAVAQQAALVGPSIWGVAVSGLPQ